MQTKNKNGEVVLFFNKDLEPSELGTQIHLIKSLTILHYEYAYNFKNEEIKALKLEFRYRFNMLLREELPIGVEIFELMCDKWYTHGEKLKEFLHNYYDLL